MVMVSARLGSIRKKEKKNSLCLKEKHGQEKSSAGVSYGSIGRNVQKIV